MSLNKDSNFLFVHVKGKFLTNNVRDIVCSIFRRVLFFLEARQKQLPGSESIHKARKL